jgi:hypothetical protein
LSDGRPPEPWPYIESDQDSWPDPAPQSEEQAQALYAAKLEARKKRTDQEIGRAASDAAADTALNQSFFQGILDVAKGSIDRARASADFVQKAAAAIGAIYTTILGVSFSVADRPFPSRGLPAAIFLGVAIVCSTYFLAWLDPTESKRQDDILDDAPPGTSLGWRRVRFYVRWNRHASRDRAKWLRASVVALAAAIALLPAAFIPIGHVASHAPTHWPAAKDAAPSEPVALRAILYQAQVTQAANPATSAATGRLDWIWWVIAAGLGVLTFTLAQFPREAAAQPKSRKPVTRRSGGW